MTPQMQESLYNLSLCYDSDAGVVFQRVVETIGAHYNNTMAMVNLVGEGCVTSRAVVNPHPRLRGIKTLAFQNTY